jgi:hypothetical protein
MLESIIFYGPCPVALQRSSVRHGRTMRYRPENDNGKILPQGGESLPFCWSG